MSVSLTSDRLVTGQPVVVVVRADSQSPLGSVDGVVRFDPSLLRFTEALPGEKEFSAVPLVRPGEGFVSFVSQNLASLTSPVGRAVVCKMLFAVIGAKGERVELTVENLHTFDTDGRLMESEALPFKDKIHKK
jgi:hypothetical protein